MKEENWEKKRNIICRYNESAKVFDSLYKAEQNLKIKKALGAIRIRYSDMVLDVGCGTGFLFEHIFKDIGFLVGLDLSQELLRLATIRSKSLHDGNNISLIRADADHMPFQREIFDKVFALTLSQNIPDFNRTLQEMMRVAKKDSTIVVTGLKKIFSKEEFIEFLNDADLEFSIIDADNQLRDYVAICHKK
ncbi:MAG: class I SAM-dependent methyltransferase [Candidatus Bathyarchaeia archaeon]